jgi:hypothetical protein
VSHPLIDEARAELNLGSPEVQGLLCDRETYLANRAHNDLRSVMSTPEGRRFVWGLLEHCGVFGPSYASDANATSYNEGRRAVGIGLMVRCQTEASEFYVAALTESISEIKAEAATRQAAMTASRERDDDE